MQRILPTILAAGLFAGAASAQVTDLTVTSNTSTNPSGFVVNDLFIDFVGQLNSNQILLELTEGSIYQDAVGGDNAPNAAFFATFPSLANDTFVDYGAPTSDGPDNIQASFAGGAVNLGGAAEKVFDNSTLDVAYFPPGGTAVMDQVDYFVGRITLSNDATGTFKFFGQADTENTTFELAVVDGQLVPEPGSLALLGLGGLAMLSGRRRRS